MLELIYCSPLVRSGESVGVDARTSVWRAPWPYLLCDLRPHQLISFPKAVVARLSSISCTTPLAV